MSSSRARRIGTRVLLVCLGIVIGLIALEISLQVAAAYLRSADDEPATLAVGPKRVVCLGDSNTYGLYLDRSQAWPQQLETLWNADHEQSPMSVANLGYPGMNSSRIRNHLPAIIDALHPDLVTVMVGANDIWTVPEEPQEENHTWAALAWQYSRVYRLFYMLANIRGARVAIRGNMDHVRSPDDVNRTLVEHGDGVAHIGGVELPLAWKRGTEADAANWEQRLDVNLAAIVAFARKAETPIVFLTYPSNRGTIYGEVANKQLRAAAEALGIPLIDLGQQMESACALPCPTLFFKDHHPNADGHAFIAKAMVEALSENTELGVSVSAERTIRR